jgi:hypothetical protein
MVCNDLPDSGIKGLIHLCLHMSSTDRNIIAVFILSFSMDH